MKKIETLATLAFPNGIGPEAYIGTNAKTNKAYAFVRALALVKNPKGFNEVHGFTVDAADYDDILVFNGVSRYHNVTVPVILNIPTEEDENFDLAVCNRDTDRSYVSGKVVHANWAGMTIEAPKGNAKFAPLKAFKDLPKHVKAPVVTTTPCV